MKTNPRELRSQREELIKQASAMIDAAEGEKRDFTAEEQTKYDDLLAQAAGLLKRAERAESTGGLEAILASGQAATVLKIPRGDSEVRAMAHFVRTGDAGGVKELAFADAEGKGVQIRIPSPAEMRAVTDSTMNITTSGDGGSLVPTGFVNRISARRGEIRLAERLGCTAVPGKGTTVNYPVDNADAQDFVTKGEQSDAHDVVYSRDAPQVTAKAFTLVKYTRKIELTEEVTDDEDAALMDFIALKVGAMIGVTHNGLLLTEVAANGTSLKTFAAAAAIAAGEPEAIVYNNTLGFYLDDATPGKWVMRNPTFGAVASITGNPRLYAQTPGGSFAHEILGYDVLLSTKAAAIAASAKSAYFGNWSYVGFREDPALRFIQDPYSVDGLLILKYSFRAVYGVLQAGAVGYGVHPSA